MTLNEFRKHPAYDYYIRTLVSDCLICDLSNMFNDEYNIAFVIKPNFEDKRKDYVINVPFNIANESEEYIQSLLAYNNYKDIYYVCNNNEFNFYLKTYSND